ncbi:predicted protein [Phaeodactylum tricornutum CCAP 1055/1]|uniref:Uncharacterized protein n=1 Tax=Phaeodactylum tricornutum (strain CCAP 1055/1) TaxID=556484 RepID=B7GA63_PHATC|nr:predicted protein [Phaeodactylum tricornutum CCAP 1055/1]EEC44560.1 predicted protein [Phaeodactylum tricornutum CCAP 1055/1]|eukprot:XP_002183891.1 predicted protein [Phaeodactylum tricornutum CCAP 1055/1]
MLRLSTWTMIVLGTPFVLAFLSMVNTYRETFTDKEVRRQRSLLFQASSGTEGSEKANNLTYYSILRKDRSGAAIHDILVAHAYCSANGLRYGGACQKVDTSYTFQSAHENLLRTLGLEDTFLPFGLCPSESDSSAIILERETYFATDSAILTKGWLSEIKSLRRPSPPRPSDRPVQVAAHVRRGDVTPCQSNVVFRYLPNTHFQRIIETRVLPKHPNANITIYSVHKSFEDWESLSGYQLDLHSSAMDVWDSMVNADILILSKSSFSFVSAIFNTGRVIYAPFWHKPLPTWESTPDYILAESQAEVERLRHLCPE